MKNIRLLSFALLLLLASACQTPGSRDPLAIPEDIWQLDTPAPPPQPTPEPALTEEEPEEAPAPRRGFFFGRRRASEAAAPDETAAAPAPATEPLPPASAPAAELSPAYLLQVGDPLIISVAGPQLEDRFETTIDERGFVKLRFIGSVRAMGRTATELEREIEAEYTDRQKIYREVYVRVLVPNNFYFIGGEVRQPGRFPLIGRVTLSQAVVAAGNFTEWARRDGRLILVRNNERRTVFFRDIVSDPSQDVELRPGDVITVERSFL